MVLVFILLLVAVLVKYGAFGWRTKELLSEALRPALLLGGVGFALGFFGPMIFAPGANQGPLLGILITGPGGFALGLAVGVFRAWRSYRTQPL